MKTVVWEMRDVLKYLTLGLLTTCPFLPERVCGADLKITEIMFVSSHPPTDDPPQHNYWWELTNLGLDAVNLTGYSWDDNSATPGAFVFPTGVTIASGESIIVVDRLVPSTAISDFNSAWGLNVADVQVLSAVEFGVPGFPGFGLGGVLHLFDPSNVEIDSQGPNPIPIIGTSNEYLPPDFGGRQSVLGENGAYQAPGVDPGDIGSPGLIPEPTTLSLLLFGALVGMKRRLQPRHHRARGRF